MGLVCRAGNSLIRSFLVSDLSESYIKRTKNTILVKLFWANCSFIMSDLSEMLICPERFAHSRSFYVSDSLTVAQLSWANRSQSLILFERSERISSPSRLLCNGPHVLSNEPHVLFFTHFIYRDPFFKQRKIATFILFKRLARQSYIL